MGNIEIGVSTALSKLALVNDSLAQTTAAIKQVSDISVMSFSKITDSIKEYSMAMDESSMLSLALEGAKGAMAAVDMLVNEGIIVGTELMLEHIYALTENEAITWALDVAKGALYATDTLLTEGIMAGTLAALEQFEALTDCEAITKTLDLATKGLTTAQTFMNEGIFEGTELLIDNMKELVECERLTNLLAKAQEGLGFAQIFASEGALGGTIALAGQIKELTDCEDITSVLNGVMIGLSVAQGMAAMAGGSLLKAGKALVGGLAIAGKAAVGAAKKLFIMAKAGLAAIMAKPFVGIALGAAAIAATVGAGVAINRMASQRVSVPAMATGGVVSAPTFALVGEGRYPEAVVPLGSSPQFASMKADIANAVMQGISALLGNTRRPSRSTSNEVVLNIDGTRLARVMLPNLENEQRRSGYNVTMREV